METRQGSVYYLRPGEQAAWNLGGDAAQEVERRLWQAHAHAGLTAPVEVRTREGRAAFVVDRSVDPQAPVLERLPAWERVTVLAMAYRLVRPEEQTATRTHGQSFGR